MSNTTNHYDLIVLGADVAGLVAAALVARRGKRVLVVPHGNPDGAYRLQGRAFALDTAPLVHSTTPPVERVLAELGLVQVRPWRGTIDTVCAMPLRRATRLVGSTGARRVASAESWSPTRGPE